MEQNYHSRNSSQFALSPNASLVINSQIDRARDSMRSPTQIALRNARLKFSHISHISQFSQTSNRDGPSFFRLLRMNTRLNTYITENTFIIDDPLKDLGLSIFQPEHSNRATVQGGDLKEFLTDYVKVRELTRYENIKEHQINNLNQRIQPFFLAVLLVKNAISELAELIVSSIAFEVFIILVILANTATLALDSLYTIPRVIDNVFLIIYTSECILKIFSMGFIFNKGSYLRDPWNILDISIVITGWIQDIVIKFNVLRTLRILRPLRNISSIKGMKVIFMALVRASTPLMGTLGVLLFFIIILAITGLETMMDMFRYHCMNLGTGVYAADIFRCGIAECPESYVCVYSLKNPNLDITSFDDIFSAFIIVFECVTLQNWVPLMNIAQRTVSYATILYYLPISFVGAFLILNLSLAVIKSSFTKSMEKINEQRLKLPEAFQEELLNYSIIDNEELKVENQVAHNSLTSEQDEDARQRLSDLQGISEREFVKEKRMKSRSSAVRFTVVRRSTVKQDEGPRRGSKKREITIERGGRKNTLMLHFGKKHKTINQPEVSDRTTTIINENTKLRSKSHNHKHMQSYDSLPNEELSPRKIPESRPHHSFAKTLVAHSRERRFEDFKQSVEHPATYYLAKLKNSIKIRKDLIKKIKKGTNNGEIKILLAETFYTVSDSSLEVVPELTGFEALHSAKSEMYTFTYKGVGCELEDALEKKWRVESEILLQKHLGYSSSTALFNYLHLKYGNSGAFSEIKGLTRERVKCIEFEDQITGRVEAHWSGYDILNENHRNEFFSTKLASFSCIIWKSGPIGAFQKIVFVLKKIQNNKYYFIFILVCVFLNALALSMEYYGMSDEMTTALYTINLIFNSIFTFEILLKAITLGVKEFSRDFMNYIDAIVILLSWLEFVVSIGSSAITAFRVIRIFRVFRVTKVAKIFRYFTFLKSLISVITYSLPKFIYLALLLMLLNLIYALLGYQIFAGKYGHEELPRSNFENFGWSFLTVFQVLTLSAYSEILFEAMHSEVGSVSALYMLCWIVIGNFILLNLFIAILLDSFIIESNKHVLEEPVGTIEKTLSLTKKSTLFSDNSSTLLRKKEIEKMKVLEAINSHEETDYDEITEKPLFYQIGCSKSYMLFSKSSRFRVLCYRISNSELFQLFMFAVIYLNCIILVWGTYTIDLSEQHPQNQAIQALETVFTIIYLFEFITKSTASGVFEGLNAYFHSYWNILDFIILIFSLLDTFTSFLNLTIIKLFRVIRAARPLRFISRNSSMKSLVNALISSIGAIFNVIIVLFIVWFIFAIVGVSVFSGKMYTCKNQFIDNEADCSDAGFEWINAEANFDNIFEAFLSLFIISLLELWHEIMYNCIDARGIGLSRQRDFNLSASYFFIIFIIVGSFFFLRLFMGVVFTKFYEARKEEFSVISLFLNKDQLFWMELQKLLVKSSPQYDITREPEERFRKLIYRIVTDSKFEVFVMGCILFNMVTMAMSYSSATYNYTVSLNIINVLFVCIFTIEAMMKIYAFGIKHYFNTRWNIFDFLVVVCGYLDILLDSIFFFQTRILRTGPQIFRIFRIFRVTRLIRIFKPLKTLHNLIAIIKHSLPSILNVLSFLLLNIFIFSIIGAFLFHHVHEGKAINEYNNFKNFFSAALVLIRISTLCEWPLFLYDCAESTGKLTSSLYFTSYMSITFLVIINLFIMVIVQNYEEFQSDPNSCLYIFTKDERKFKRTWENYSRDYHGVKMDYKRLLDFMLDLGESLGFSKDINFEQGINILSKMSFMIEDDGTIFYHELLYSLLKRKYGMFPENNDRIIKIILQKEENKTLAKLKGLKRTFEWKLFKKTNPGDKNEFLFRRKKSRNLLVEMVYLKQIFHGWKTVVRKIKDGDIEEQSDE